MADRKATSSLAHLRVAQAKIERANEGEKFAVMESDFEAIDGGAK